MLLGMARTKKVSERRTPLHHLAAWRRRRELTQPQLGERIGMAHSSISRIETGETDLTHDTMVKLLAALRITACELFCDPADQKGPWIIAGRIAGLTDEERATVLKMLDGLSPWQPDGISGSTETKPPPSTKESTPRRRARRSST